MRPHRLSISLSDATYRDLKAESERAGTSIAEIINVRVNNEWLLEAIRKIIREELDK